MKPRAWHAGLLLAICLAAHLPWLVFSPGAPYDMASYALVAACPAHGLYTAPGLLGRYPYLPLWWLCLKALGLGQRLFGGAPDVWFRLPALAGDMALCWLAYLFASRRGRGVSAGKASARVGSARLALFAGLAWALNPLALIVSAGHGQFDSLALGLVLGAAWLLEYSGHPRADVWAALCLALGIALKTWPLAFLPVCLSAVPNARARFTAWTLLPPLLLLLPWLYMDGFAALAARLSYSGANGLGLSGALKAVFFAAGSAPELWRGADTCFRGLALAALGCAFVWAFARGSKLSLSEGLLWMALSLVLFAPGLSPQYLVWAPAVALAVSVRWTVRLSLAALPLALSFYALFMPGVLVGRFAWTPPENSPALIAAWGACNLLWWCWMAREWKGLTREYRL